MVAAPAESCPKCGAARQGDRACPRCGLAAHRMETFALERDARVPPAVAVAWERALEAWDELPRHDALLQLVAQHDAYAWAAAKYRDAKRARPASPSPFRTYPDERFEAIADRQLDRMRRAAEATMLAGASARRDAHRSPYRATVAVMVMLIVAIIAGLLFATVLQRNPITPAQPGTEPAPPRPK